MSDNVKSENRRAMPKFFLAMLGAVLAGLVLGVAICWVNFSGGAEAAAEAVNGFLCYITPWGLPAAVVLLGGPALALYFRAKRRFAAWDQEDEDEADAIDMLLTWVLLLASALLIMSFFFFASGVWFELELMVTVVPFLAAIALVIVIEQKAVDLTKRMNPEKKGSVYDVKFRKKWLDSCDEAERAQIGQAAMCAYQMTSRVCLGLWLVLLIMGMTLDIGLLPVFLVTLIMGVSQISYMAACVRMGRRKGTAEK